MNTVFEIDGINYEIAGVGQLTASAALQEARGKKVVIKGFVHPKTRTFIPVKLK